MDTKRGEPEDRKSAMVIAAWRGMCSGVRLPDRGWASPSECEARCYTLPPGPVRAQCLADCAEQAAIEEVASRLAMELYESFADVIWGGGDIDPLPLASAVRSAFGSRS